VLSNSAAIGVMYRYIAEFVLVRRFVSRLSTGGWREPDNSGGQRDNGPTSDVNQRDVTAAGARLWLAATGSLLDVGCQHQLHLQILVCW